ncbi:hypothetical protein ALC53_05238 [Atta colombica]|uniref:Uncharacterized protein n=1 Tax=Atta colombica TaxID=520822 RepID=A0A195BJ82_9HYME|nr:hypothetical protein ALC53_05238 [Atta colombica]
MSRMISVQQVELTTINARGMWAIVPQKVDCLTSRLSAADLLDWYYTNLPRIQILFFLLARLNLPFVVPGQYSGLICQPTATVVAKSREHSTIAKCVTLRDRHHLMPEALGVRALQ